MYYEISRIARAIKVYSNILILRDEYLNGIVRNDVMERLFLYRKKHLVYDGKFNIENNDQALHFLNIIAHSEWYQVDGGKRETFVSMIFLLVCVN